MSNAATSAWDQLICPYFTEGCRHSIGSLFGALGFEESEVTMIGEPVYRKGNLFVQVGYEPDTFSQYSPTIVVGRGSDKFDACGQPCCVPLWFLIPENTEERKYSFWTFSSAGELAPVLAEIWDCVVEPYVKPLLANPELLVSAIENFRQRKT